MRSDRILFRKRSLIPVIIALFLLPSIHAGDSNSNDLWFLISSYEDIGITPHDLAKFLIAFGFNAKPEGSHVIVILSADEKVYLTPNGGASGLADLWKNPPNEINEPIRVNYANSIKKNATYHRSYNLDFIKSVSRTVGFPITPLGMCKEGSEQLGRVYRELGYNVTYMYTPNNPGHEWALIEDDSLNTWLAVDSYYGVMTNSDFYTASYSFPNSDYLDLVNPRWRIS